MENKNGLPLKLAWLYPLPKRKILEESLRKKEPTTLSGIEYINNFSIKPILVDPCPFPLNPFRYYHAEYSGIDILRALKILFTLRKYDVILSVGESSVLILLILRRIFKFRKPIIIWDPCIDFAWGVRRKILDIVIPLADKILLISSNQKDVLEQKYNVGYKCEVIYYWIDCTFFKPNDISQEDYIFSIGDDKSRDFFTLIEALNTIRIKLKIKTRIPVNRFRVNNTDKIDILREKISFPELRRLYSGAKFVVIPLHDSIHSGGITSLLESMAMGKATIVSGSMGIRDFIKHNKNAIVVKCGDVAQLKDAILYLLNNPKEIGRIGNNVRKPAEEIYDIPEFSKRLAKAIWEVHTIYWQR